MASTPIQELNELHALVARHLKKRIDVSDDEMFLVDAATIGVAVKFLKDNNVSADPADKGVIDDLQARMVELAAAREARRKSTSNVLRLADSDLKVMEG